jgi:threonine synthase
MGLPIGEIICCCNANAALWELFSFGQLKTSAKLTETLTPLCDRVVPAALELLIRERLDDGAVVDYFDALERGGTFFLEPESHQLLREGFSASVVSDRRMRLAMPNLYNTNGYILGPYSALVYTGLMDYRSHPGPRRTALMLTEQDPRENADIVTRALVLSSEELDQWCQHG